MPPREYRSQIDGLRERVRESDVISDDDAELLIEFTDRMDLLQSRIGEEIESWYTNL